MASKSNIIDLLQVDPHQLALLRVRRSASGIDVVKFDRQCGDWTGDTDGWRSALKDFVSAHGIGEHPVYSVVPRYDITTRILTLPSTDAVEIGEMISLSAEEYVPFARSELVIDQAPLCRLTDGSSRVLAAFARREGIEAHIEVLRSAGITPEKILLSTACLASAIKAAGGVEPGYHAVVNLGASGLEILILGPQGLEYSRAVSTRQDWDAPGGPSPEAADEFAVELRAAMAAHRRESEEGLTAEIAYVCSEGAAVSPVCDAVAHELTLECVPAEFGQRLVSGGGTYEGVPLVLLGAALSAQDRASATLNLIPASLAQAREQAAMRGLAVRGAALGLVVVGMLIALFIQGVMQRSAYIAELERHIAAIHPTAEATMIKQRQLRILQRQVEESASVMELLAKITELTPDGANISRFSYDMAAGIIIVGRARSETVATHFADRLRSAQGEFPVLAQARTPSTRTTQEFGQTVYEYEITIPFPDEDELVALEESGT